MPQRYRRPTAALPLLLWQDLALNTGDMLAASAQVIGHRTRRIAAAGPSPSARDRREFHRMGAEKIEAAGESMWAMAQQFANINMQLLVRAWEDVAASGTAWMAFASSRTLPQMMDHQLKFLRSMSKSAGSASQLSGAAARIAHHGLAPIHSRAAANAKRLARVK